ncbi:MAG: PLP-dependent cysteine synthase family protein [bacterium]
MSILDSIGNTPLIRLERSSPNPNVTIWAKLELCNPSGSLKDRIAVFMIERAEKSGALTRDKTIIEATSGNTGIALGMVAAVKGYKVAFYMSEAKTIERRKMLRHWGAELILTTKENPDSHIFGAKEAAAAHPERYFYINQNENEDNVLAHYQGTGREIVEQSRAMFDGAIDAFVAGFGTGGCLMGMRRAFHESGIGARIVAVEPQPRGRIDGLKHGAEAYQPLIYDRAIIDETINVRDEDAFRVTREIAAKEGVLAGISSGATLWAAQQVASRMERGNIVVIFGDRGERYFSTEVFNQS